MNRKTTLVTLGVAATVTAATITAATITAGASAAAVAVPALAASRSTTVTQHFDAKSSSAPRLLSRTSFVLTDNDVQNHKTIGHDVLYCTDTGNGASHCHVAFAQKGGLLYARFVLSDKSGTLKGAVTGGTDSFAHAKGTIAGTAISRTDVKITLHYKR